MAYQTIDPSSGKHIKSFDVFDQKLIEAKIKNAENAYSAWKAWPIKKRAEVFYRVADAMTHQAHAYAELMELEMGKPQKEGIAEIKKCAVLCNYYADHAESLLAARDCPTEAKKSYVRHDPLGIILAISPWNFPFWQVFRVAVPTLMAGNVLLFKHATNTPQCALAIEDIFTDGEGPRGIIQSLFVSHEDVKALIADARIKGVSLTGSTKAGTEVAKIAGMYVKPCVMELGGSDPFIVFNDAEIKTASEAAASARCLNSGQSCINAKRFVVHKDIADAFLARLVPAIENQPLGPLATKSQRALVHEQVADALQKGARVLCGGVIPEGPGFFYPATVLTHVNSTMRVWSEEVFGPVAAIIPFETDLEACSIANATVFGLGASIWTDDQERIERMCADLECGLVFVNQMVRSDPRLPFGGIKQSGFGRELGQEGILSFVNVKTVWINA